MKLRVKRNVTVLGSVFLMVCVVLPSVGAGLIATKADASRGRAGAPTASSTGVFWGLIFAVGYYYNHPDKNRPEMINASNSLQATLLDSSNWQPDHIHLVQGSEATGKRLMQELRWLAKNSQPGDYVLVYITTHGAQMRLNGRPLDLPPKDEPDGMDEFLMMYNGFDKWYSIVWDDPLNLCLSAIKCQGLCLIVDSCFSGGFNDRPLPSSGQQRVVLMSCAENEESYGTSFSDSLITGFQGWADWVLFGGNGDGVVTAEEAFGFAQYFVSGQTPTIADYSSAEFPVTYV